MIQIKNVAFFAYSVTDLPRAREFYQNGLGLTLVKEFQEEQGSWIEYDIDGATLAITNMAPNWKPSSNGGSIAFEVENFSEAMAHLKAIGATIVAERIDTPVCEFALIQDPDGNGITIHKLKDSLASQQ